MTLSAQDLDFYRAFPKVELHRHLEGSLRLGTLQETAQKYSMPLPASPELAALVQVLPEDPPTSVNFLSKFQVLRTFYRSPELIQRFAYEAVADAAEDGVRYLELRFTPVALSRVQGYDLGEVINWVTDSVAQASRDYSIRTGLIASINRHESLDLAVEVTHLVMQHMAQGIVGIDLAGNESDFSADPFAGILREAQSAGLHLCIHAGEWNGPQNVIQAIETLKADRIGHGIRIMEDPGAVALAKSSDIPFEVCITSNYQSGVIPSLQDHPIRRMLAAGINVTINTDDPAIEQTTLSQEYHLFCEVLGASHAELAQRILAAAKAAFLPDAEREALVRQLQREMAQMGVTV